MGILHGMQIFTTKHEANTTTDLGDLERRSNEDLRFFVEQGY